MSNFEFWQVTYAGGDAAGAFDLPTFEPACSPTRETYTGSREVEPAPGRRQPDALHPRPARRSGRLRPADRHGPDLFQDTLFSEMPEDAVLAVVRVDGGIPGLVDNFPGYDLLLVANLTDAAVQAPSWASACSDSRRPC